MQNKTEAAEKCAASALSETVKSASSLQVKPMAIKVKSADGKPKNIQITTLTSEGSESGTNLVEPKAPEIKIRSVDGKPKNIQFTTLATFTSPKSKGVSTSKQSLTPTKAADVKNTDNETGDLMDSSNKGLTPKSADAKNRNVDTNSVGGMNSTHKRIQFTTLELYNKSDSTKQQSGNS